jgi:C terminal of Calcineurin-like phosphoesterase/N terminal of Calcineurin-like phosphoesterase/Calcineurin-like phosphoesterase
MRLRNFSIFSISFILLLMYTADVWASENIKGLVFFDINNNGIQNSNEQGIKDVLVSNGIDIVKTDQKGNFNLKRVGHLPVFLIKPSGYQLSTSNYGQSCFYEGSETKQASNLQFGLFKQDETTKTDVVLLGDIQPHNIDEIYYSLRTSIDELKNITYDFSLALGDIVSDNPVIFPFLKQIISTTDHPSYYSFGNHDLDWELLHKNDIKNWDIDFIRTVGPTYYAMSWGNTNILSINNINVNWSDNKNKSGYDYFINKGQMTFIRNYLSHIKKDDLLIIASHARPDEIKNKLDFYKLFQDFSNILFVFGHYHRTENYRIGKEQGWPNETPAHCIDAGAVCGGHWRGEEDMFGIPSATMTDGTPKGYVFLEIDTTGSYNLKYKASGMPDEKQMHIFSPDYLTWDENFQPTDPTPNNFFYANIYLGGEQTKVEYKVDGGDWLTMQKVEEPDPYLKRIMMRQKLGIYPTEGARKLKRTYDTQRPCSHLWKVVCPSGLSYGVHELEVRFTDPYIQNSSQKHGFIYLSPELKKTNKELNKRYKSWVDSQ